MLYLREGGECVRMGIATSSGQRTGTISYKGVKFETVAAYEGTEKKLYTFDESLARLQRAGLDRHSRPQEVFSLLIANLENKLTPEQKAVAEDMLNSCGEWLSLAMLRKGNKLSLYYDPKNLVWNRGSYEAQGSLRHGGEQKFNIKGLPSHKYVNIQRVNVKSPQLVQTLWTRPFKDLPEVIQNHTGLYLPPDGQIWPVGRGNFNYDCDVNCCNYNDGASRGVVVGAPKKPTKKTKQMLEEQIAGELAVFDSFIGKKNQPEYAQLKKLVLQQLTTLYHGK